MSQEDKIYGMDSFYKVLERVFDKFPKYHMKMLLGNLNAKEGREDSFNKHLGMRVYTNLVTKMELE
jgi:hypothetical protein